MTKRLNSVLSLEDPFTTTLPSYKRQKCFFVGRECFQYILPEQPPSSSILMTNSQKKEKKKNNFRPLKTFLHLPPSIRETIFSYAFRDLLQEDLLHPYDDLPPHSRFQIYLTCRLLNRQISFEVKRLFERDFSGKVVFYADNGVELFDLWKSVTENSSTRGDNCMRNVKFCLRGKNFDDVEGRERVGEKNRLRECMEELVECQEGFKFDWRKGGVGPGFYEFEVAGSMGWLRREGGEGFRVGDGGHGKKCGEDCVGWKVVEFPSMGRTLRLRSFVWNAEFVDRCSGRDKTQQVGSLVLEGRICDLDWRGWDVEVAREQVAMHHGLGMDSDPYDYGRESSEVYLDDYRWDLDGEMESDPGVVEDILGDSEEDASGEDDW